MNNIATLAIIQETARGGRQGEAEAMLVGFLSSLFPLSIKSVEIRRDTLSLNSVNGFVHLEKPDEKSGARVLFFKFHHEESEEGLKEYYNSKLLDDNGYPVEMPLYASHEVGKQVLLYPFKSAERMADLCKRLDKLKKPDALMHAVLGAQEALDALVCERYLATLHDAPRAKLEDETLLQLFHHRLVDERAGTKLGGRHKQFYAQKVFELPGSHAIRYEDLASYEWRINGVEYPSTLAAAFADAFARLAISAHSDPYPAVIAHGDAHNGNVWYNPGPPPHLSLFDPAFAGAHSPALLAEIKPTFHNIFAHPLWLYDSQECDQTLDIRFRLNDHHIEVEHTWRLSALREGFLKSKADKIWKPLIAELRRKKKLPAGWAGYMRSALFCCPTLVMNLRAHAGNANNFHTPKTSLLGLSVSMMLATPSADGNDAVSEFFADLE